MPQQRQHFTPKLSRDTWLETSDVTFLGSEYSLSIRSQCARSPLSIWNWRYELVARCSLLVTTLSGRHGNPENGGEACYWSESFPLRPCMDPVYSLLMLRLARSGDVPNIRSLPKPNRVGLTSKWTKQQVKLDNFHILKRVDAVFTLIVNHISESSVTSFK